MSADAQARRSMVLAAEEAKGVMMKAMAEFHCACVVGDWDETEIARQLYKDAADAFFDNYAGSFRLRGR